MVGEGQNFSNDAMDIKSCNLRKNHQSKMITSEDWMAALNYSIYLRYIEIVECCTLEARNQFEEER
jgi:hypothetical protein